MMWKRFASGLAVVVAACSRETTPAPVVAITVPTEIVRATTLPRTRAIAGTIRSATTSSLAAKVIGNVVAVHVREGDRVRAGQLLVEIDNRDARAQSDRASAGRGEVDRAIEAADANVRLAEATFRRYAALRERGSVSAQELDDATARRDSARAEVARLAAMRDGARAASRQAETYVEWNRIVAPFDGIVTARFVDPGAQAAPGMPLVTIEDASRYRVEASVDESVEMRIGDRVGVEIDGRTLDARVTQVVPALDAGRSALVKIDLAGTFRSGAYARVLVPTGVREAVTVPAGAIRRRGQLTSVLVVGADGIARMRLVTLGDAARDRVEILSGLDAGERIVTDVERARDGVRIESAS